MLLKKQLPLFLLGQLIGGTIAASCIRPISVNWLNDRWANLMGDGIESTNHFTTSIQICESIGSLDNMIYFIEDIENDFIEDVRNDFMEKHCETWTLVKLSPTGRSDKQSYAVSR